MPTVLRQDGFQIRIYPHDHPPAHVHVVRAGGVAIINLDPVEIREFFGMNSRDVRNAVAIVEEDQDYLLERWDEIHG